MVRVQTGVPWRGASSPACSKGLGDWGSPAALVMSCLLRVSSVPAASGWVDARLSWQALGHVSVCPGALGLAVPGGRQGDCRMSK